MRDPNRIKEMLNVIERIWSVEPDIRFNQLLYILQSEYSSKNDDVGKVQEKEIDGFTHLGFDMFNVEDDSFLTFLKDYELSLFAK